MKKIFFPGAVLGLCGLWASAAVGVLTVNFDQALQTNRVQYFWNGDSSGANASGRAINSTPGTELNVDDDDSNNNAAAGGTPPTGEFVFGSSAGQPNSQTIKIRVWNGETGADGNQYTSLRSFSNPALSPATENYVITYSFIRALPARPEIYRAEAAVITEGSATSTQVTFKSRLPAQIDGLAVEIGAYNWELKYNDGTETILTAANQDLQISTPTYQFNTGDTYQVRVQYVNLWGTAGPWSEPYQYTVDPSVVNPIDKAWTLVQTTTGINTIAIPFINLETRVTDTGTPPSTRNISNVSKLITEINRQAGSNVVTVFGWWDEAEQKHVGLTSITYGGADIAGGTVTGAVNANAVLNADIVQDKPYQVSVNRGFDFSLRGFKQ